MCPRQFLAKLFQQCLKTIYLSGKVDSLSTAASNIEGQLKRCVFDQNELKNTSFSQACLNPVDMGVRTTTIKGGTSEAVTMGDGCWT